VLLPPFYKARRDMARSSKLDISNLHYKSKKLIRKLLVKDRKV
jgi:hypothetical protein